MKPTLALAPTKSAPRWAGRKRRSYVSRSIPLPVARALRRGQIQREPFVLNTKPFRTNRGHRESNRQCAPCLVLAHVVSLPKMQHFFDSSGGKFGLEVQVRRIRFRLYGRALTACRFFVEAAVLNCFCALSLGSGFQFLQILLGRFDVSAGFCPRAFAPITFVIVCR